jgi:hypothetical protein
MAHLTIVVWVLVGLAALLVGVEISKKWLSRKQKPVKETGNQRPFQSLAMSLRNLGHDVPKLLVEYEIGGIVAMMKSLDEMQAVAKKGNDALMDELDGVFERVLAVKLGTPEGRALVKAKLEAAAVVAAPIIKAAVVAAL